MTSDISLLAYYNEIDNYAADWLERLIEAGLIAPGKVDRRSITDVQPEDLVGYRQCHFFAGIGGWSLALRIAGWSDSRPIFSGSCPCQPFSFAGKQEGQADERHLWPEFARLIRECKPPVIIGEQVEGAVKHGWLDGVFTDLEGAGYACGAAVLGAHSVGAPHIRQRLYWVADTECDGGRIDEQERGPEGGTPDRRIGAGDSVDTMPGGFGCENVQGGNTDGVPERGIADRRFGDGAAIHHAVRPSFADRLGDGTGPGLAGRQGEPSDNGPEQSALERASGDASGVGHASHAGFTAHFAFSGGTTKESGQLAESSPWNAFRLVHCRDSKTRRISAQSGDEPLVHGIPRSLGPSLAVLRELVRGARRNRVGRLNGYGNAICVPTAVEFIRAFMDVCT